METTDEIAIEDHPYFLARLNHLECLHPAALLNHLEVGTLTQHLRDVTAQAMEAKANLVFNQKAPEDQADEMVMNQIVADQKESSRIDDPRSEATLQKLLNHYRQKLPSLPRTYLSENEITE